MDWMRVWTRERSGKRNRADYFSIRAIDMGRLSSSPSLEAFPDETPSATMLAASLKYCRNDIGIRAHLFRQDLGRLTIKRPKGSRPADEPNSTLVFKT